MRTSASKYLTLVIAVFVTILIIAACATGTPPTPEPAQVQPAAIPEVVADTSPPNTSTIEGPTEAPTATPTTQPQPESTDSQSVKIEEPPPVAASIWEQRAPLLEANSETAVAELDGKIYVLGGYPSTRNTVVTVQVYDSQADTWEFATPLPLPINHGMAAAIDGKLYVIGGQVSASGDAGYLDTVYQYDPGTAEWTARAQMPTKRSAGATAVIGDKIYVAGGRPPQGNDFAVYDTREDTWTVLPDLPTQRNHLAAAAIDGKVYVVGGRFGGGWRSDMTDTLEVYDPAANTWSTLAPMPTVRGGINGIAANGCLYVFGGEGLNDRPNGVYEDNEVYDPVSDTWHKLEPIPIPVHGVTGSAFIDGRVHLPGGGTSSGGSSGDTIHQVFRAEMRCN